MKEGEKWRGSRRKIQKKQNKMRKRKRKRRKDDE
jgi:hypothetical protein